MKSLIAVCLLALALVSGCMMPLKPGHSSIRTETGKIVEVQQSENPKQETTQVYKRVTDEKGITTEEVNTKIGAAQKDVAREMAAKLGSLRPVMYVGILVFLFGAASFVYPPLKIIVGGSVTTSVVIALAGLAMIVLPTLVVGNELVIMGVALGVAVAFWFSHRHGKLQGLVDANKNGIDDREEQ